MAARAIGAFALVLLALLAVAHPLRAEGLGVVAVANDQAITELDVTGRINLLKIVGDSSRPVTRKQALQMIVDDIVKIGEAKRVSLDPTDAEITQQIDRFAKNMKTTPGDLKNRLAKQGINEAAFRSYMRAQIGFNRIIASKYRADVQISDAAVDAKMAEIRQKIDGRMAEIKKDPRMKAMTVYSLIEITLPVERSDMADSQLLQSRAIEASQVAKQFRSCKNARAAAEGVFNVKFSKLIEADGARLPGQMRAALDKAGVGRTIGPMRAKEGIQLIAFCGTRKISPQMPKFEMPSRAQIESMLINEKYAAYEETYLKDARKKVYIEYRNASYSQ